MRYVSVVLTLTDDDLNETRGLGGAGFDVAGLDDADLDLLKTRLVAMFRRETSQQIQAVWARRKHEVLRNSL